MRILPRYMYTVYSTFALHLNISRETYCGVHVSLAECKIGEGRPGRFSHVCDVR